jgi:Zn-dependent peptidase ImmA (M78 family)
LTEYPEVEIASLIAKRHAYEPGSNLLSLVKEYADVEYLAIPVPNVDGVSTNLKIRDRRPSIIVSSQIATTRQQFTLAHEFGHVLIPWHIGTIFSFSSTETHSEGADQVYWEMEAEANRFAAELLMPQTWLRSLHAEKKNPAYTAKQARKLCGTSMQAIIIAINNSLPPGFVYAAIDADGHVLHSTASRGTYVAPLKPRVYLDDSTQFHECNECFEYEFRDIRHNWLSYEVEQDFDLPVDTRPWREILDEIVNETGAEAIQSNIKASLNAIVASSNKREFSATAFYAAVRQNLMGRGRPYEDILLHPSFSAYLVKRIEDLMARRA